jgi:hypothetical protein
MRVSPVPTLRGAGAAYVEVVRNTPLTVVFFFVVEPPRVQTLLANSSLVVGVASFGPSWVDGGWAWCLEVGDVVACQRVHGDPRRDGAGCQGGVPQGLPGDACPRRAGPAVHRRAVHRAVRGTGTSRLVAGAAGAGAGAGSSSRASPTGRPPTRYEHGWTGSCALGLDLCDPGFDASVLTEFRARLLADGQAERLLTLMLGSAARAWPAARGRAPAHRRHPRLHGGARPAPAGTGHRDPPRRARGPGGSGAIVACWADSARVDPTLGPARRRLAAAQGRAGPRCAGR